jgi:WD40 repeat protein
MTFRSWSIAFAFLPGLMSMAEAQTVLGLKPGARPIEVKVPARKEPIGYTKDIVEILEEKCTGCHGSAIAENRLSLEDVGAMLKGGKRGPALVSGKSGASLLFRMAAHQVEPVMPPKDKPGNASLTSEELGLLKLWIDAGARDDSAASPGSAKARHARAVVLGELPPGVQPINAVDMTAAGTRLAAGRANIVQVYDVDSGQEIVALGGHKDLIHSLRFSPDGSLLAAGSYQIITLWNVPTGGSLKTLVGHAGPVQSLAVTADGTRAFSGGDDKTIRGWNIAQGKQEWALTLPSAVSALAITGDGKTLLTGCSDAVIRLIDLADHRERASLKGHTAVVEGLAPLRSDAQSIRFVSASADGTARIWTIPASFPAAGAAGETKVARSEPSSIVLRGHKGAIHAVTVSPDLELVITAGEDATLRTWNARDGNSKGSVSAGLAKAITALAISPDGKTLATGSVDKTLRLRSLGKESVPRILDTLLGTVNGLAFSPRGDRLVASGSEGGIKVLETASGRGVIAFGHSPVKDGGAVLPPVRRIAFTGEGSLISASGDGTLKTWTFAGSWTERGIFGPHADRILTLDFSPDGKWLAAGGGEPSRSGELKVWDVGCRLLVRSMDSLHSDTVFAVRFSPDGSRLASAAADKFLKVTLAADGKELRSFEGHTHHVMAVDWKADGKQLITGGADKVLKLWEYETGEQVRTLQEAGKQITAARWIAGKAEVVAASGDAQLRIWNPDTGAVIRGFSGPSDYVYSVASSVDGTRITAGGADSVLFIWNGRNGQLLRKIEPPPNRAVPVHATRTASKP